MHSRFTTWTRRRAGGITIHRPADQDIEHLTAASAAHAAELHMAKHEDADVVAVKPASDTQYFRRDEHEVPTGNGLIGRRSRTVVEALEIPPVLEGGVDG